MSDADRPDRRAGRGAPSARATSSAAELFDAYRERAAADELNAYTWVADDAPAEAPPADAPLAGVPVAVKDLFCTEGVPSQAGSRILEDYRPPYTATSVAAAVRRRRAAAGQDEPGRVRDGLVERELRLRPDAQPVGPRARSRRVIGRQRRGGRRRQRAVGDWAPTRAARSASRPRCAASSGSSRPTARSAATG